MQDLLGQIDAIRRPRLLIRAARIGAQDYRRQGWLTPLLPSGCAGPDGASLQRLLDMEEELDSQRRADAACYSVARHLDVLIAVIAEARLLRAAQRPH